MAEIRFELVTETNRETSKTGSAVQRYLLQYADPGQHDALQRDLFVLTRTPTIIGGLKAMIRKSLTWEPLITHGPKFFAGWFVNVNYSVPEKDENGDEEDPLQPDEATATPIKRLLSRRFYGEDMTIKIDTARKTEYKHSTDASHDERIQAEGYGDMVRPTKEGPEGFEIPISNFAWEENWSFPYKLMSDAYIQSIPDLKHHTNKDKFRGFKPHEVMLADYVVDDPNIPVTAEEKRLATVTITFKFVVDPEAKVQLKGIPEFTKKGWHLITPIFREKISEDQTKTSFEIISAQHQQIHDQVDFSRLKIT